MTLEHRLSTLEAKAEMLDKQVSRILSHIQSEDGTVERSKNHFNTAIADINKQMGTLNTNIQLMKQTLENNKYWARSISIPVILMFLKGIYDILVK